MIEIPTWIPPAVWALLITAIGGLLKKLTTLSNEQIKLKSDVELLMKVFFEQLLAIKHSPHTPDIDVLLDEWKSRGLHDAKKVSRLIDLLEESIKKAKTEELDESLTEGGRLAAKTSRVAAEGLLEFINRGYRITNYHMVGD